MIWVWYDAPSFFELVGVSLGLAVEVDELVVALGTGLKLDRGTGTRGPVEAEFTPSRSSLAECMSLWSE